MHNKATPVHGPRRVRIPVQAGGVCTALPEACIQTARQHVARLAAPSANHRPCSHTCCPSGPHRSTPTRCPGRPAAAARAAARPGRCAPGPASPPGGPARAAAGTGARRLRTAVTGQGGQGERRVDASARTFSWRAYWQMASPAPHMPPSESRISTLADGAPCACMQHLTTTDVLPGSLLCREGRHARRAQRELHGAGSAMLRLQPAMHMPGCSEALDEPGLVVHPALPWQGMLCRAGLATRTSSCAGPACKRPGRELQALCCSRLQGCRSRHQAWCALIRLRACCSASCMAGSGAPARSSWVHDHAAARMRTGIMRFTGPSKAASGYDLGRLGSRRVKEDVHCGSGNGPRRAVARIARGPLPVRQHCRQLPVLLPRQVRQPGLHTAGACTAWQSGRPWGAEELQAHGRA